MVMPGCEKVGLVVIGRNEGERLKRCLASVRSIPSLVYVDSGSTDGSVASARAFGASVVELSVPPHFTAARARNAGLAKLMADKPDLEFVQMIDGDCEVQAGWIAAALETLRRGDDIAVALGRLRERFPDRSIYIALCDDEWDIPIGDATGCGGNAMFRVAALRQVNFYNPKMIAGEDSELSMRLRNNGWRVRRIDVEMALHDAAITRFGQWWTRTRRSGHAFGEMAALHPDARYPNWSRTVRSIMVWGGLMPAALTIGLIGALRINPYWWIVVGLILLQWPLRMVQLAVRQRRRGLSLRVAIASGFFLIIGKMPQLQGLLGYYRDRFLGRASRLIEYKEGDEAT
jgi:GT2 family glycosyltransferase